MTLLVCMRRMCWLWSALFSLALAQPAPVAHYPFDGDVRDHSGNANHGTRFGPTFVPDRLGRPGRALAFDGVDDYLTYRNAQNFHPSLPATIALWVRIDRYRPNFLFSNNWQENAQTGIWLLCNVDGTISFGYGDGGSIGPQARRSQTGRTPLLLEQWYHVAVVIRGPEDMDLYLDGRRDCGPYGGLGQALAYTSAPGRSGHQDQSSVFNSPLDHLHGALDELRLYDVALSAEQVRALFVGEAPRPRYLGLDTALCIFDSLRLPSLPADQYQWSPATGLSCLDCPQPVAAPRQDVTYRLIASSAEGCRDTITHRVEVNDCCRTLAWANVEASTLACATDQDGAIRARARAGSPPYEFALDNGPWQAEARYPNLPAGSYRLRLRDAAGCQRDTTLTVSAPPPLAVEVRVVDSVSCAGDAEGAFLLVPSGGTSPYQCDAGDHLPPICVQRLLPVGDYPVSVEDANGCLWRDTVRITGEDGLFTDTSDLQGPLCAEIANGRISVRSRGGQGPYAYAIDGGAFQPGPRLTGLGVGTRELITRDASGCLIRQAIEVRQTDTLQAQADLVAPLTQPMLLSQAQVQFRGESDLGEFFEWDFGLEGARSLAQYPSFTYPEPGEYEVILTVRDATLSCEAQDTLLVEVIPDGQVFLPNAFTPNGDGRNDRFVIGGEGLRQAELAIYSRWGREIYRSSGIPPSWDGQGQSGEPVPEGTYVFHLTATRNDGRTVQHSGTVMVLR